MPRYIALVHYKGRPLYFEWSTIVDAPVTYGMSLEEFKQHYRERYGSEGMRVLGDRLDRVHVNGTSSLARGYHTVDALIEGNRAGPNESELSKEELIKFLADE
jgi:hypothetical protein